ncbi:MAG: hypothetical protein ACJ79E_02455 [Anaeromyxobacteraceae bacterium]
MTGRFGVTPLVVAIGLASAAPAVAFVQSRGSRFNECLRWKARSLSFAVNGAGANERPGGCPSDAAVAAVERAFSAWPQTAHACTDVAFTPAQTTTSRKALRDGQNVVLFRNRSCGSLVPPITPDHPCHAPDAAEDCSSAFDCWDETVEDVIATTSVSYVAGTGEILEADMEINAMDSAGTSGFLMTCSDTAPATDIQNVVTHEAGHLLGLAHACEDSTMHPAAVDFTLAGCPGNTNPTMFPSSPPGELSKRSLEPDDVAGVCFLYPRGEAAPECVGVVRQETRNDTGSSCGSGSAQPDALALLAIPAILLRRRGRRAARAQEVDDPVRRSAPARR